MTGEVRQLLSWIQVVTRCFSNEADETKKKKLGWHSLKSSMMRLASAGIFKNKIEPQYNCSIWTTLNVRGILLHSGNVFFRFCCESKLLSLTKEQAPNFAEPPFKSSERCLTHKITIFSVLLKSTGLEKTESGKLKRTQSERKDIFYVY